MKTRTISISKKSIVRFICIALVVAAFLFMLNTCDRNSSSNNINIDEIELVQLEEPEEGDKIMIMDTSMGEIRAILYPEYAPNTVSNIINLANSGYYDGTYIYRVEDEVYFAGGSPNKDGSLNSETYKKENEEIANEYSNNLWPFRGAFFAMSGESGHSGSRFMVANSIEFDKETKEELLAMHENTKLSEAFIEYGGIPNYSQQMTIFAQTYEGFDVIDKITSVVVADEDNKNPKEDIIIKSMKISSYSQNGSDETTK